MGLTSAFSWEFGDLFNRFVKTFSWEVGDGSSLVFTKLDFWIFFLVTLIIFSLIVSKRKWIVQSFSILFALPVSAFLLVAAIWPKTRKLIGSFLRGKEHLLLRSIFLTGVSLFFFFKTSGLYMLLLVVSLIFNYVLGKRIFKSKKDINRKWIIAISAIFNLLILGYFKYAYFFTASFNDMFHTDFELINHFAQFGNGFFGEGTFVDKILLPVGVSFFTFQNISYVVDIYRKEIEPVDNFFHYSFFVTFFPQLVMGPIVRARDFIPQITQPFSLVKDDFSWAVIQIMKGLVKKIVIADFLVVHLIDKIVFDFDTFPGFISVIAMWAYSLHIYADFSGYTDIAIGLSRLMGFKLKPNFNSPYKALNVGEFWRRWHMSLGSWLKDYLYIPLGGNRTGGIGSYIAIVCIFTFVIFITQWWDLLWVYGGLTVAYLLGVAFVKNFKRYVHRDLNLIITMVVGGLWHGPSENFVIWGAMNGAALVIFKYWNKTNLSILGKWSEWYFFKPVFVYAIYYSICLFLPYVQHIMLDWFFWIWIGANISALMFKSFRNSNMNFFNYFKWRQIYFWVPLALVIVYSILTANIPGTSFDVIWYSFAGLFFLLTIFRLSADTGYYASRKERYVSFWKIFITFNFITLTRVWFKLDEARQSPFEEAGLTDAQADVLPMRMLDHIWNNFNYSWEYFINFVDMYQVPLIIMVAGFIIHWMPNKFKEFYESLYMKLPMVVQAVCIAVIVFFIYQAIGAEQPPFVYLQF